MIIYRGEKLTDKNYLKEVREKGREELKKSLKEFERSIENLENKDIELNVDYSLYTKPVEKLTIKELCLISDCEPEEIEENKEYFSDLDRINRMREYHYANTTPRGRIDHYKNIIAERKKDYEKNFIIAIDKNQLSQEVVDNIIKYIRKAKEGNLEAHVCVDADMKNIENDSDVNYTYSKDQTQALMKINQELKANGYDELKIREVSPLKNRFEFENAWSLSQVIRANNELDVPVEYIKKNKLSPFEAVLYVHNWVSKFSYTMDEEYKKGDEGGRVLPSVFTDKEIICGGYATLVKAILDKVKLPGLKCDLKGCILFSEKGGIMGGHCHNVIHIVDEKYGINGTYLEDACWDSKRNNDKQNSYAHCLYPVKDLINFNRKIKYSDTLGDDRYNNVISAGDLMERSTEDLKVSSLVKKYKNSSKPIPLKKYKEGLTVIYSLSNKNREIVDRMIEEDIIHSKVRANNNFNKRAVNVFSSDCTSKERKNSIKKAEGPKVKL